MDHKYRMKFYFISSIAITNSILSYTACKPTFIVISLLALLISLYCTMVGQSTVAIIICFMDNYPYLIQNTIMPAVESFFEEALKVIRVSNPILLER